MTSRLAGTAQFRRNSSGPNATLHLIGARRYAALTAYTHSRVNQEYALADKPLTNTAKDVAFHAQSAGRKLDVKVAHADSAPSKQDGNRKRVNRFWETTGPRIATPDKLQEETPALIWKLSCASDQPTLHERNARDAGGASSVVKRCDNRV